MSPWIACPGRPRRVRVFVKFLYSSAMPCLPVPIALEPSVSAPERVLGEDLAYLLVLSGFRFVRRKTEGIPESTRPPMWEGTGGTGR